MIQMKNEMIWENEMEDRKTAFQKKTLLYQACCWPHVYLSATKIQFVDDSELSNSTHTHTYRTFLSTPSLHYYLSLSFFHFIFDYSQKFEFPELSLSRHVGGKTWPLTLSGSLN